MATLTFLGRLERWLSRTQRLAASAVETSGGDSGGVTPPRQHPIEPSIVPPGVESIAEREAARIAPLVSGALAELGASLHVGLRTSEIERRAVELLRSAGLAPRMLGFRGFPAAMAVSLDEEVVHGIPCERRLSEGQLVKLQLGAMTQRGFADQGWTFAVGRLTEEQSRLRTAGKSALQAALGVIRDGARTGDLGAAIAATLGAAGFWAVPEYQGYGIGAKPMQEPWLPCVGVRGHGDRLVSGMILHVHAIATAGRTGLRARADQWTMVASDGRPAVLFTACIRVQPAGYDLLTPLLT